MKGNKYTLQQTMNLVICETHKDTPEFPDIDMSSLKCRHCPAAEVCICRYKLCEFFQFPGIFI